MLVQYDQKPHPSEAVAASLARTMQDYLQIAGRGEDTRRRDDRIGSRLWHGQHYIGVRQNPDRSAIVANVVMALVHHKVSIMVKQRPVPIVEASDEADKDAAELMRSVVMHVAKEVKLDTKARNCEILANTMRTSALKWVWDRTKNGGIGGIDCYEVPGYSLILDTRASSKSGMQFCGDRATMFRSEAMAQYPQASQDVYEGRGGAYARGQEMDPNRVPVRDPWGSGSNAAKGAPTSINGKPVFTAYAGDPGFGTDKDDLVEVCEVYHRDLTEYQTEEQEKDPHGNVLSDLVLDEESGEPLFAEKPPEMLHGSLVPVYELIKTPRIKQVWKRKYPMWRRTTTLMPEGKAIEDIAWDGPLPYAFFDDTYPITGVWSRGSALQLETLQGMTNVGLSIMTDNMRLNSVQAFTSDPTNGLQHKTLVPGPGQVIPVPPGSLQAIEFPKMDQNWFTFINQNIALMERVFGAQGIMQGEAAGRVDSAAGYDMLAEIGGSRIVECTQRMESSLADCARIIGWFAQNYFTEEHAIGVEGKTGEITWERAWGPLLKGSFRFEIEVGSTLAWSESAKYQRWMGMYRDGVIDKIELWKRIGLSGWQEMKKRMDAEAANPAQAYLLGGMLKPPKPPKATPNKAQAQRGGKQRAPA